MTSERHQIFTAVGAGLLAGVVALGAGLLSACKGGKRDEDDTVRVTTVAAGNFDFFYTPEDIIDFSDFTLTVTIRQCQEVCYPEGVITNLIPKNFLSRFLSYSMRN